MSRLKSRGGSLDEGISEDLIRVLRQSDITVVNNEFPYTNRGTPTEGKTFTFRADTDAVHRIWRTLARIWWHLLRTTIAYDFGETGAAGYAGYAGAGRDSIHALGAGRNLEGGGSTGLFHLWRT